MTATLIRLAVNCSFTRLPGTLSLSERERDGVRASEFRSLFIGHRRNATPPISTRMSYPALEPDQNRQARLASITKLTSTVLALRVTLGSRQNHATAIGSSNRITLASVLG